MIFLIEYGPVFQQPNWNEGFYSHDYQTSFASLHHLDHRKKRYRKYFKSRIDAVRFQSDKERELGISDPNIETEVIFLPSVRLRTDWMGSTRVLKAWRTPSIQESFLSDLRKPPAPRFSGYPRLPRFSGFHRENSTTCWKRESSRGTSFPIRGPLSSSSTRWRKPWGPMTSASFCTGADCVGPFFCFLGFCFA